MTETITYCVRGCTRKRPGQDDQPRFAERGRLCRNCARNLDDWLREIPDRYALLPEYVLPTTARDENPDSKATKRTNAPVPLRLDVVDLLDTRRGRKWLATAATEDRRGTIGTLLAWSTYIRAQRGTSTKLAPTVSREADTIRRNLDWLCADDAIADAYDEIRTLHRQISDAIGIYRAKPVGTCTTVKPDEEQPCGGPLMPTYSGVHCPRCGASWDQATLRLLGRTLDEGGAIA